MTVPTYESTKADYTALLMKVQIKPGWQGAYERAANYIVKNRARYQAVAAEMGSIPWAIIGCWHWREAEGSFAGVLHNGDRIIGTGRKTYHVPAGRGPFDSWEEAAVDALKIKGLEKVTNWNLERVAYESERFNGFGYRMHYPNVKSPYLWAGTNNYTKGKYVSDGRFDRNHVDQQIGVMALFQMVQDKTHAVVTAPKVSLASRINAGMKWLGGAVGSLFTLDSLGTLQTVHSGLGGIFTAKFAVMALCVGVAVWAGLQVLDLYTKEKEDVGTPRTDGADQLATP